MQDTATFLKKMLKIEIENCWNFGMNFSLYFTKENLLDSFVNSIFNLNVSVKSIVIRWIFDFTKIALILGVSFLDYI